jgi:membrane-bound lytic murein transglycosylase B
LPRESRSARSAGSAPHASRPASIAARAAVGLLAGLAAFTGVPAAAQTNEVTMDASPDSLDARLAELSSPAGAERFERWLADFRAEAAARGIAATTLDRALADVRPIPRVIELDHAQPESKLTFREYLDRTVPAARVAAGRRLFAQHRELLNRIGAEYGVPPRVIVALWGIESDYGRRQGGYGVVPALATLAYEGRRGSYFRSELFAALRILDEGHVSVDDFRGSWAGAMGQCQFMPSSFGDHAVDYDGDGKRNIWSSPADVFASTANYLRQAGWEPNRIWGRVVQLPSGFDMSLAGRETKRPLAEWQRLGVRRVGGGNLPEVADLSAALILPDGPGGPAYLVYRNFDVLLAWNRSTYFATAVGILSDRIGWHSR